MRPTRQALGTLAAVLGLAAGYFLLARLGIIFGESEVKISPFWPAAGFALMAAMLGRRRDLAGVALGAFASAWMQNAWPGALGIALGSTASAWLGAWLMRTIMQRAAWLGQQQEALAYLVAALFGPLIAVLVSGVTLIGLHRVPLDQAFGRLLTWWSGDALGVLAAGPACLTVLAWVQHPPAFTRTSLAKSAGFLAGLAGIVAWLLLVDQSGGLIFLLLPLLVLLHILLGEQEVKIALLVVVAATVLGARLQHGATAVEPMLLEVFLSVFCVSALLISSLRRRELLAWPTFVLFGGWLLSGWLFLTLEKKEDALDELRFSQAVATAERSLIDRMTTYIDVLRGGASLLSVTPTVTNQEWQRYISTLALFDNYPGIHGVGVVYPLRTAEVEPFIRQRIQSGHPPFKLRALPGGRQPDPTDASREHFLITLIAPLAPNLPALGLDLGSEPVRREAAEHARDTGRPHLTGNVTLVQDGLQRPGFLLFLPVYDASRPTTTVAERRAAFRCWVYAPFVDEEFVLGAHNKNQDQLDFALFEGASNAPQGLLYADPGARDRLARPAALHPIELAQQLYTFAWFRPSAQAGTLHLSAILASSGLAMASVLLASLILSLQSFALRSERLVKERTRDLERTNLQLHSTNESLVATKHLLSDQKLEAQKLALVAAHTTDGLMRTTAAGQIEWISDSFTRSYGYTLPEIVGLHPGPLLQGPETDPQASEQMRTGLQSLRGFTTEILHYRKDRTKIWVSIEVHPIFDENRQLVNYIGIQRDITERKEYEQKLEQEKQRAEAANRSKSAFLATISHELRTPLNVILGNLQLLLSGRHGPIPVPQARALELTKENSSHLLSLINDLLDLNKAESGKLSLDLQPVNVTELCHAVVEFFGDKPAREHLQFEMILNHLTPVVVGDPLRLKQILINLLGNALKFTPAGGHIALRVDETEFPRELTFSVIDTGPGVKSDDQERIFHEFEQIGHAHSPASAGTGLGLPIARRLAEAHGGRLTVESQPDAGSRFIFVLPIREPTAGAAPAPATSATPLPPAGRPADLLILAVEDYPANLELLVTYLELESYRVAPATHAEEAIAQAIVLQPNLILMDVKMPGIDGLEATRRLKADPRTRHIPVVMLTAFAAATDVEDCLSAGADGFLAKPVDFAKLDAAIAQFAARRPA